MKGCVCVLLLLFTACSSLEQSHQQKLREKNRVREPIYRKEGQLFFPLRPIEHRVSEPYPWQQRFIAGIPRVNKYFFRCRGSYFHPVRTHHEPGKETTRYFDCGGAGEHSLPMREGEEFIYPILIDLLNWVQEKTTKPVIITTGHRCPKHNAYADDSKRNRTSKHLIGAEVDFYVEGLEEAPQKIVDLLMDFYRNHDGKEYRLFNRYEGDTDVITLPWYNKEIFIKLYQAYEGRDFDNAHSYPYVSIQVRYDHDTKQRVLYSWDRAQRGYLYW